MSDEHAQASTSTPTPTPALTVPAPAAVEAPRGSSATGQGWDPGLYRENASFVPLLGAPLLDLLAPAAGERILDLGCGTGELTATLAGKGAHVLGIDASPSMIEAARARFPALSFRVAEGEALPFEREYCDFDAIFSNAALHWMPDAEGVAAGMFRVLRPGGRLVAELGGYGCVQTVRDAALAWLGSHSEALSAWPRWFFPKAGEYGALLERQGFLVESLHLFPRPTPLQGEEGLTQWLEIFAGPVLARLGAEAEAFLAHMQGACRARLFRDGVWSLDYVRLRVSARRPAEPSPS